MRSALLALLLLVAFAVPASAQAPTGPAGGTAAAPVATASQDDTADDPGTDDSADDPGDDGTDDPGDDTSDPGDFTDDPLDGSDDPASCGTGDYDYCGCNTSSDYADYAYYCRSPLVDAAGGGEPGTAGGIKRKDGAGGAVKALPASSLPYTGDRPAVVALIGLSFVMIGAGGRLRLKR